MLSLNDPGNDTGASSHFHSDSGILKAVTNTSRPRSVLVGDGSAIPVVSVEHTEIPNPYRPPHLYNVLITPNIIKNLISVRQFTKQNKCSIEFDEFGFSVKDYLTRQMLLRCDSTDDLYPVTSSKLALTISSQPLWHQRLGHPSDAAFRFLVSNNFISCNKHKNHSLCHSCQLGKNVRL